MVLKHLFTQKPYFQLCDIAAWVFTWELCPSTAIWWYRHTVLHSHHVPCHVLRCTYDGLVMSVCTPAVSQSCYMAAQSHLNTLMKCPKAACGHMGLSVGMPAMFLCHPMVDWAHLFIRVTRCPMVSVALLFAYIPCSGPIHTCHVPALPCGGVQMPVPSCAMPALPTTSCSDLGSPLHKPWCRGLI